MADSRTRLSYGGGGWTPFVAHDEGIQFAEIHSIADLFDRLGYEATRWGGPFNFRLCGRRPTLAPVAAMHNDLGASNVSSAIRKRTFAAYRLDD